MNADGSGQTNVSHDNSTEFNPAWSPDGAKIAYDAMGDTVVWNAQTRTATHYLMEDIFVMNADGSGKTQVTFGTSTLDSHPAWQPLTGRNYYWTWYDMASAGFKDWVLMANPAGAVGNLRFNLGIAGLSRNPGDLGAGPGVVPPGRELTPVYPGVISGPVEATSLTGDKAVVSQRTLMGSSFEEVLGTDESKLSDHFYWTWYDMASAGFKDWVLISNPQPSAVSVNIKIGGVSRWSGTIGPGQSVTPTFPGVIGGSVEVDSTGGPVLASQRVLTNSGSAFNEVPGIPRSQLSDRCLWTWYDNQSAGAKNWVLIANPGVDHSGNPQGTITAHIKIAGATYGTYAIAPGQNVTPTFPGKMGGPVEVFTDGGDVIATQRSLFGPSFEEVPGMAASQNGGYSALANSYQWTWYDQQSPGMTNWVLVANPGGGPLTATIKVGGSTLGTYNIAPGKNVTPTFPGRMGGPVQVSATGNVIASQRVLYNGYFNEVLGQ